MGHMIDMSNDRENIAYLGSRNDIWHRLGNEMKPGQPIKAWAKEAGLNWEAIKVPAYCQLPDGSFREVEGHKHIVRNDTWHPLGYASDRYQPVQPIETLEWMERYISVDDRFELDVAGSLKQGEIIWATAKFNGGVSVGGDHHIARLLMTTTFDGTGATINKGTMTRTICKNTLDAALAVGGNVVKTRHSTKFNADKVSGELASIVKSFEAFKAMGDAMVQVDMSKDQVSQFFKKVLGIDPKAKEDDISVRKLNQFHAIGDAYKATVAEGTKVGTAWCALNAVTRYVDHERETRGGASLIEAKFLSSQFGSGSTMKTNAVQMLKELCNID